MGDLTIANIGIRSDGAGRYCLNDFHRASGGNPSHAPGQWLRNKQAQELAAELTDVEISTSPPIVSIKGGDGAQGTFVAKELVYAYAMWISPSFHLKVIRAYDSMLTAPGRRDPMDVLNDPAAMRGLLLGYTEKVLALQSEVKTLAPKAAALDRIAVETDGAVCLRVAAKLAQVPEKQFIQFMHQAGWITRHHHSHTWMGYSDKEAAGLLELKRTTVTRNDGSDKTVEQVLITPRGLAKLTELIERKAPWLRKTSTQVPMRRLDGSSQGVAA